MIAKCRLSLRETRPAPGFTRQVAEASNREPSDVLVLLRGVNDRLRQLLSLEADPIVADAAGTWRADGVAGLVKLSPDIELEIAPKFLAEDANWQNDFFLLATLVRTGRVLISDAVSAGIADRPDLATLIGRALVIWYGKNARRPIKAYRRSIVREFSFDGEVDLDSFLLPDADGYRIDRLQRTGQNSYNSLIKAAADLLVAEVGDADTRVMLQRLSRDLGPQARPIHHRPPLPARYENWQPAYELASLVVDGYGLDLRGGLLTGPGFVLSTWSAWETLCEELVRRAVLPLHGIAQRPYKLGTRLTGDVLVRPDVAVCDDSTTHLLLDAKYKTRVGRKPSVNAADLYEALAFLRASQCSRIILIYPTLSTSLSLGEHELFDHVEVGQQTVEAAMFQVSGLSSAGGFEAAIAGMKSLLASFVEL